MKNLGQQLKDEIKGLRNNGTLFINHGDTDSDIFEVIKPDFHLKIVINSNWLGLEFELLDQKGDILLSHAIDTDLYDLSQPENRFYAKEIEGEIIQFLNNFASSKIMVGKIEGERSVVIPGEDMYIRIKSGKRVSKMEHFENEEQALAEGTYHPLVIQ